MARLNRSSLSFIGLLVSLGTASLIGCGLDTHGEGPRTTSAGAAGGTGGTGGDSGTGGMAGGGGGMACKAGVKEPCYTGPANTPNIGTCKAGTKTCLADGTGYGPCEGEVVPVLENCVTAGDEDCDTFSDLEDSECVCTSPGFKTPCDTGKLGVCKAGVGECSADGRSVAMCMQKVQSTVEDCVTPEDDDCDGAAPTCTGTPIWTQITPGAATPSNDDSVYAVAMTPDGGYIIAGTIDGQIDGNFGYTVTTGKAYIAKFDSAKALVWEKRYSATTMGVIRGIAVDKDGNIIIGGAFSGTLNIDGTTLVSDVTDAFLAKLNPQGAMQWTRHITAPKSQTISGVTVDPKANIFVVGTSDNDVNLGGGPRTSTGNDFFMASYATDNMHRWSKIYESGGEQFGAGITMVPNVDPMKDPDVAIIGNSANADVDLGGGTIAKGGQLDFFVARYAGDTGNYVWGKLFGKGGGMEDQVGRGIATTPDGNIVITGGFANKFDWKMGTTITASGTSDVYVGKLDGTNGDYLMHAQGGKSGTSVGNAIATDASGHVTVFGHFNGSIDFAGQMATSSTSSNDTLLVKLKAADLAPLWLQNYGTMGHQFGWAVAVAADGKTIAGGGFNQELLVPPAMSATLSTGGMDLYGVLTNP